MCNHRVEFITSYDSLAQLFCLCYDNSFGCHQRDLMRYTNNQFLFIKRFGNKIVTAHLKSFHDIRRTIQSSKKDHWNFAHFFIGLHLLGYFETADIRHHHIQQHKIRFFFLHLLQSLSSIACCYNIELLIGQKHLQQKDI